MFQKHNENIVNITSLYTVKETAQILRVKENTIYAWCYQKKLTPIKSGSKSLFLGAEILNFLNIDRNIVLEINTNNVYNISTRNHNNEVLQAWQ